MTAERVVGVVLAGGSSSRLGRDKSLLEIARRGRTLTLAAWAAERLRAAAREIVVAGGDRTLADLGLPPSARLLAVGDGPGRGPVAGLLGAAEARPGRPLLALACDLPRVTGDMLQRIALASGDWVVPAHGDHLEPTCALYRSPAIERLRRNVERGEYSLYRLAREKELEINTLDAAQLAPADDWQTAFFNLNRPRDLAKLRALEAEDDRSSLVEDE